MTLEDYRRTLQDIDGIVDGIMEDASFIDSALLDAAFGEPEDTREFAAKGMLGYVEDYLRSIVLAARRALKNISHYEEAEREDSEWLQE